MAMSDGFDRNVAEKMRRSGDKKSSPLPIGKPKPRVQEDLLKR